ncbi:MAG: protein-tyrosine-phosphatase [Myxococcota bacterium]
MRPLLRQAVAKHVARFNEIPPARRATLEQLSEFIASRRASGEPIRLTFICTHNSRRSHMAQLWAAAAATHYGVGQVCVHSGGTEATAFNPRAIAAIARAGFGVDDPGGDNPHVLVSVADETPPIACFSKVYDHPVNPREGFAAVMTCSSADEACPVVLGAAARVAIPYEDPKVADGTDHEAETYDLRSNQIATEILYAFSRTS